MLDHLENMMLQILELVETGSSGSQSSTSIRTGSMETESWGTTLEHTQTTEKSAMTEIPCQEMDATSTAELRVDMIVQCKSSGESQLPQPIMCQPGTPFSRVLSGAQPLSVGRFVETGLTWEAMIAMTVTLFQETGALQVARQSKPLRVRMVFQTDSLTALVTLELQIQASQMGSLKCALRFSEMVTIWDTSTVMTETLF